MNAPLEREEQRALSQFLDLHPLTKGRYTHVPNERSDATQAKTVSYTHLTLPTTPYV